MAWVAAIRRVDITFDRIYTLSMGVCSRHFHTGDYFISAYLNLSLSKFKVQSSKFKVLYLVHYEWKFFFARELV